MADLFQATPAMGAVAGTKRLKDMADGTFAEVVATFTADGGNSAVGATGDATWSGTGSGSVIAILKNIAVSPIPTGTNSIGAVQSTATTITDIASAAITSTATSSAISTTNSQGMSFQVTVTAASGTNPALDVVVQESLDGTNWTDIYHFVRLTGTGFEVSPVIPVMGQYIRYVRTVAGTTPSFTMSVLRRSSAVSSPRIVRRIFNRSLDPNTLSAATPAILLEGCQTMMAYGYMAAGGTAPTLQLQASNDGVTGWVALATNAMNPAVAILIGSNSLPYKWWRVVVTTAGSGSTLGYLSFATF